MYNFKIDYAITNHVKATLINIKNTNETFFVFGEYNRYYN